MKKLLVISASARIQRSHSRGLTEAFVKQWERIHPGAGIVYRELGTANVPHMTEQWIAAAFKPAEARSDEDRQALAVSDIFVSELHEADVIVIGSPMYNWSIPSPLKAYVDQIMRVNETWRPNRADKRNPYTGLLQNKTLVLLLARGSAGYEPGEYNHHMNYQSTYLKTVFGIMGISDVRIVAIDDVSAGSDDLMRSIGQAYEKIGQLMEDIAGA